MKMNNVDDVRKWRLCIGCGACKSLCPEKIIMLENVYDDGIRPKIQGPCKHCGECLKACSGLGYDTSKDIDAFRQSNTFGNCLEIWEGFAGSENVRYKASSGGLITALASFALEEKLVSVVHHIIPDPSDPLTNTAVKSHFASEVLRGCGSRYAPASPCEEICDLLHDASRKLFIGKPCDVGAIRKGISAQGKTSPGRPLMLGFFCAGTPSTLGTIKLLEKLNIQQNQVNKIRYRGKGWPGNFDVSTLCKGKGREISYEDSWGYLQTYRPFRCYLCPDGTSELADISLGDAWYRKCDGGDGLSLAIIRTERGRILFHKALLAGRVVAKKVSEKELLKSQKNLLDKRRSIFGRLVALRLFGIPTPKYIGFSLFRLWLGLSTREKFKSFFGTVKRIVIRRYFVAMKTTSKIGML